MLTNPAYEGNMANPHPSVVWTSETAKVARTRRMWRGHRRGNFAYVSIGKAETDGGEGHKLKNRRFLALATLGGECIKCHDSDWRHLQIDHIHDNGAVTRKSKAAPDQWSDIIRNPRDAMKNYQVLCANHNWQKRYDGEGVGPYRGAPGWV